MFARMLEGNRVGCWGTTAISDRRVGTWIRRMSMPPSVIDPVCPVGMDVLESTSYKESRSEVMVDFPEPEAPTIAVQALSWTDKLKFRRTRSSGLDG